MVPGGSWRRREVALPAIFQLYHDDFGGSDADVLYWLRTYVPAEIRADLDRALQKEDWVLRYHPLDVTSTNAAKPTAPAAGTGSNRRLVFARLKTLRRCVCACWLRSGLGGALFGIAETGSWSRRDADSVCVPTLLSGVSVDGLCTRQAASKALCRPA